MKIFENNKILYSVKSPSPKWLLQMLQWVGIDGLSYQISQVEIESKLEQITTNQQLKKIQLAKDSYFLSDLLKSVPLFYNIPDELVAEILNGLYQKVVNSGEVITKQGEVDDKFFIVVDGQFDVSVKDNKSANDLSLKLLEAGDYFGEMALLENLPRQATITAKTKGSLLCINKESFDKILKNLNLQEKLYKSLQERKIELKSVEYHNQTNRPSIQSLAIEFDVAAECMERSITKNLALIKTTVKTRVESTQKPSEIKESVADQVNVGDLKRVDLPYQLLRLIIDDIREKEESEIINNKDFGLVSNVASGMSILANSPFVPKVLDELISLSWKEPSFFLAHPEAIAVFKRNCNNFGINLENLTINISPGISGNFVLWQNIPIIPSDKIIISNVGGEVFTDIFLIRNGWEKRGVVGLYSEDCINNYNIPGFSIEVVETDANLISKYLIKRYFSVAMLAPDAVAISRNVGLKTNLT